MHLHKLVRNKIKSYMIKSCNIEHLNHKNGGKATLVEVSLCKMFQDAHQLASLIPVVPKISLDGSKQFMLFSLRQTERILQQLHLQASLLRILPLNSFFPLDRIKKRALGDFVTAKVLGSAASRTNGTAMLGIICVLTAGAFALGQGLVGIECDIIGFQIFLHHFLIFLSANFKFLHLSRDYDIVFFIDLSNDVSFRKYTPPIISFYFFVIFRMPQWELPHILLLQYWAMINSRNISSEKHSIRIHKRQERKKLKEKENAFVLDCLNEAKSHIQRYNSINDKFLKYSIIKVRASPSRPLKTAKSSCDQLEKNNHKQFQEMLKQHREKIMKSHQNQLPCISKTNKCRTVQEEEQR